MNSKLISLYSQILFEYALKNNKLETYYDLLSSLLKTFEDSDKLFYFLFLSYAKKQFKKKIVYDIFHEQLDFFIITFIWAIIDFNHVQLIVKIFTDFLFKVNRFKKIKYVKIYSSNKLSKSSLEKLKNYLKKYFNSDILLKNIVNNDFIGGIKLETENFSIDNLISSRLIKMKNNLIDDVINNDNSSYLHSGLESGLNNVK